MPSGTRSRFVTWSRYWSAGVGGNPAQDSEPQVRVLEHRSRGPGEPGPGREQAGKRVEREPLLAIAPWIVRGQPRRHREQLADRDRAGVRVRRRPAGQLRDVLRHGVVEVQPPLVAQPEDQRRRERLGHRGDAEHGVGVRGARLADERFAEASGVHQFAVADDAPGDTRHPPLIAEAGEAAVDGAERLLDRGHRPMMPGDATNRCRPRDSTRSTCDHQEVPSPIYLLVGSTSAGKSTAARALATSFERGVHVPVDDLRHIVVTGATWPGPDSSEALVRQVALARSAAVRMALDYAAAGFAVVIDDFFDPLGTQGVPGAGCAARGARRRLSRPKPRCADRRCVSSPALPRPNGTMAVGHAWGPCPRSWIRLHHDESLILDTPPSTWPRP